MGATISAPGLSLSPDTWDVTLTSANAVTEGDVCVADEATASVSGSSLDFSVAEQPAATVDEMVCGIFMVALEDIAAGAEGRFRIRGVVKALYNPVGAVSFSEGLSGIAGQDYLDQAPANHKIIAKPLVEATGGVNLVLFDGWSGFGFIET